MLDNTPVNNNSCKPQVGPDVAKANIVEQLRFPLIQFGIQPYDRAALSAAVVNIKNGEWTSFDKLPLKDRLFAVHAMLIEQFWQDFVLPHKDAKRATLGLEITLRPLRQHGISNIAGLIQLEPAVARKLVYGMHNANLQQLLDQFCSQFNAKDFDYRIQNRGLYSLFNKLSTEEIKLKFPSTSRAVLNDILKPDRLKIILSKALEFGLQIMWQIDKDIAPNFIKQLAQTHGLSAHIIREAMNSGVSEVDNISVRSERDFLSRLSILRAELQGIEQAAKSKLEAELGNGNSSFNPQTLGCPVLVTPMFMGLLSWIKDIKDFLRIQ